MFVIDVNTSFGKRVDADPRYCLQALAALLDDHQVAAALSHSMRGVDYNSREGNDETLAAARTHPAIIPVGIINPRNLFLWKAEYDRCRRAGIRAFHLCPGLNGWTLDSELFREVVAQLRGEGIVLLFSLKEKGSGFDCAERIARLTAPIGCPVILTDSFYGDIGEIIPVMRSYPHIYADVNGAAAIDNVEVWANEVGARRLLYGSCAPIHPMQKALNQLLEADLSDDDKSAILGANMIRLLGIGPDRLAGRPQLETLEPKRFAEPIIDVHSHLGFFVGCSPEENYDPARMLRRMKRFNVTHSIVSSYESMRYDIAAGNRRTAEAIQGRQGLLGYVELNPWQLELSCAEMDRYYRLPNFVGAEIELNHIPAPTGGEKVRALLAEVARRGKPVLFKPSDDDDGTAERDLARQNPGLTIIHAHGFDAGWARKVADTPTICVEYNQSRPRHHDIRDGLDILGADRVLFGTDQILLSVGASIGSYMDAQLTEAERRKVLHENARRIFRLA